MRLLLISGAKRESEGLRRELKSFNYGVDLAEGGEQGLALASEIEYDAIVVRSDRDGPIDGPGATRLLRSNNIGQQLMVMTLDVEEPMVVAALDAGADQVMDQRHGVQELLARVRGLLRQCDPTPGDSIRYEEVRMELPRMQASRAGRPMELIGKPYALLEFFVRNPEIVCTREAIGRSVWDQNFDPFSNVIDVTVSKIRQQLDKPFGVPYLHTVVGRGYMFGKTPPGKGQPAAELAEVRAERS
jgi:two-component system OmpR family response regulator